MKEIYVVVSATEIESDGEFDVGNLAIQVCC